MRPLSPSPRDLDARATQLSGQGGFRLSPRTLGSRRRAAHFSRPSRGLCIGGHPAQDSGLLPATRAPSRPRVRAFHFISEKCSWRCPDRSRTVSFLPVPVRSAEPAPPRPGRPDSPLTRISESSAWPSRHVKFRSSAHLSLWNLLLESCAAGLSSTQNTQVPRTR